MASPDDHPPDDTPRLPRRGGLIAGLDAGIRGFFHSYINNPSDKSPRVLQRIRRSGSWVALAPMLCFAAVIIYAAVTHTRVINKLLFLALFATILVRFGIWCRIRQTRARAAAANFRICPHCGYSLAQLDESGTCPECGHAYSPSGLKQAWNA